MAAFPELEVNRGRGMSFRWRCMDCGQRQIATETDTSRYLVGLEGTLPIFGGWDYRAAASQAQSKSKSVLGSGYHYMEGFANLLKNGTLNPFLLAGETQTPAALVVSPRVVGARVPDVIARRLAGQPALIAYFGRITLLPCSDDHRGVVAREDP